MEGSAGCECWGCAEYFERNTGRVRKALREIEGGDGCGCGFGGSCDEEVTKVIYERPRKPRSGNVHVGWSLR